MANPRHYIQPANAGASENDYVQRVQTISAAGVVGDPGEIPVGQGQTLSYATIAAAGSGDNAIVAAAGAGNRIYLVSYVIVVDGAVAVKWRSATTDLSGAMSFAANGGAAMAAQPSSPLLRTAANEALNLNLSGAVGARGHLSYFVAA